MPGVFIIFDLWIFEKLTNAIIPQTTKTTYEKHLGSILFASKYIKIDIFWGAEWKIIVLAVLLLIFLNPLVRKCKNWSKIGQIYRILDFLIGPNSTVNRILDLLIRPNSIGFWVYWFNLTRFTDLPPIQKKR